MGFVTKSEIDLSVFLKSANEMVGDKERYKITLHSVMMIKSNSAKC